MQECPPAWRWEDEAGAVHMVEGVGDFPASLCFPSNSSDVSHKAEQYGGMDAYEWPEGLVISI